MRCWVTDIALPSFQNQCQQSIFPKIYVTSVMAGEKSGSLTEVLDRYISYQMLSLAVRKVASAAA